MDSRFDRYIDDELSEQERVAFENEAAADAELRRELERAMLVKQVLGSVPSHKCPPDVEDAVLRSITRQRPQDRTATCRRWSLVPALGVFLLLAGIALFLAPRAEPPAETYTTAEVQQALHDVQYALGIVGYAGATTAGSVREEVFQNNTMENLRLVIRRALLSDNHTNQ